MTNRNESPEATEKKQHINKIFGLAAPTYDRVGPRFFTYFGQRLVTEVEIPTGAHVLDVATGRGAVLFPAADSVGPEGAVTGIDLTEGMVLETSREIAHRKLTNAKIYQMDAEYLEFEDQSFEAVLCGFSIFFFPQLDRALTEFHRVLKPGGHIAWTTFEDITGDIWAWIHELLEKYPRPQSAEIEGAKSDDAENGEGPIFDTPPGVAAIMTGAGFIDAEVQSITVDFVYADEEEFWATLYSHGMRATLERIVSMHGEEGLGRFKADLFEHLASIKQADGIHQQIAVLITKGRKSR